MASSRGAQIQNKESTSLGGGGVIFLVGKDFRRMVLRCILNVIFHSPGFKLEPSPTHAFHRIT